ncbi:syntaxin family protein [Sansalvadorimonas verongulae]|uniref:hypothetical protein n=1 Tax=Sansalvadorimonas verongulae TaxID=2172824 RepID=UPI0012BB8B5D|nr:hypothetical protein [Sansalvadorimonas verongulae]MTI15381.1 hypothetical protein [Sansalvadorimonas verongulae]
MSHSISQPFADPATIGVSSIAPATESAAPAISTENHVERHLSEGISDELRPLKKKQLRHDYKVTVPRKIKLLLKKSLHAAVKGAITGGVVGLAVGSLGALFTMHIAAIPLGTGVGVVAGAGIGGTIGALKSARSVLNLTPAGLLEDKISDANDAVKKASSRFTAAINRADDLMHKMRKQTDSKQYRSQPSWPESTQNIEDQLKKDIKALNALKTPDKADKANLKAMKKTLAQLEKANTLKATLTYKQELKQKLEEDLKLLTETINPGTTPHEESV